MSCAINSGISKICRDGSAGLVTLYSTEFANLTQGTITSASGIITNVASFLNTGSKFWTWNIEFGKADETETINPNTNGTLMIGQELNVYVPKKQAAVAQQVMLHAQQDLLWIVKDKNGKFRLLGEEFGMRMASSTAMSGKMGNDDSGYQLKFTAEERKLAYEVPSALMTALLAAA